MMNKMIALFLFSLVPCFALASLPQTLPQRAATAERNVRVVISFHSICCGINAEAREKLDEFIAFYEKRRRVQLAKDVIHWGREGEVDYCFKLAELPATGQAAFIKALKTRLKDADRVTITENTLCPHQSRK